MVHHEKGGLSLPIVAIATAPGVGGVGIVRVSGAGVLSWAEKILGKPPTPRFAHLIRMTDSDLTLLDEGLLIYFPAPHSYTGEDVIEFQGHGGPVVLQRVVRYFLNAGARLAEPGEFTQRAFLNGQMDLSQAEAVCDLIHAQSEQAADAALGSLTGVFSEKIKKLSEQMVMLRVQAETFIDFGEDVPLSADWVKDVEVMDRQLQEIIEQAQNSLSIRDGLKVALVGEPNVGKSSLMNALSGSQKALVTDIPGTTRDLIRSTFTLKGCALELLDTAGLRETDDPIEKLGIEWALEELKTVDHVFFLKTGIELSPHIEKKMRECGLEGKITWIFNKIDLEGLDPYTRTTPVGLELGVSAKTGQGLDLIENRLMELSGQRTSEVPFLARARHVEALKKSQSWVREGLNAPWLEAKGECLKWAHDSLCRITGTFGVEDLLGEIFSKFCIGK